MVGMNFPFGARPMFRGYVGFRGVINSLLMSFTQTWRSKHCGQNTSKDPGLPSESKDIKVVSPKLSSISNLRFPTWPFSCKQLLNQKTIPKSLQQHISNLFDFEATHVRATWRKKKTVESVVGYLNFNTWIGSCVCRCHDMNNQLSTQMVSTNHEVNISSLSAVE